MLHHPFFIKLFNWEYWPFSVVYAPVYLYWFWLVIKSRAVFFFNTANPLITNGGFLLESKKEIYDLIPAEYYPPTLLFKAPVSFPLIQKQVLESNLQFPLIAKPDIGMKGLMVQRINNPEQLKMYADHCKVDFLVQEYIPYKNEAGIFYYRLPNENRGYISGIVGKEFLSVTGDGTNSIEALLCKDKRFILQLAVLKKTLGDQLYYVLPAGEKKELVPYGNHARGSKFIDISHLIDEELTATIDRICKEIPGFYFGRLDVRYNSWEELKKGEKFSIIELNGAGSEPTHIYDPKHSIFFAWKEIIRHHNLLFKISRHNHLNKKLPYMQFSCGIKMLKDNTAYVKLISTPLHLSA